MRVGIVGYGVIGRATGSIFPDLVVYDPMKGHPDAAPLAGCDVVFVCVPTPTTGGRQDLSIVEEALEAVAPELREEQVVAIRSTVLPGSTALLQKRYPRLLLAANPEFLRAHQAAADMREPHRVVIGADHPTARDRLVAAYDGSLIVDVRRRYVLTDATTAELIKYAANAYLATKMSYFNEMYDICQELQADYEALRAALGMDPRIGPGEETHINPRSRGFDDECLPKDLEAFIGYLVDCGFPAMMFQGAAEVNDMVRGRVPVPAAAG
jgi:UDPglucose 6-dehydrogenase